VFGASARHRLTSIPYVRYPSTRGGTPPQRTAWWAAGLGTGIGRDRCRDRLAGADPHRLGNLDRTRVGVVVAGDAPGGTDRRLPGRCAAEAAGDDRRRSGTRGAGRNPRRSPPDGLVLAARGAGRGVSERLPLAHLRGSATGTGACDGGR